MPNNPVSILLSFLIFIIFFSTLNQTQAYSKQKSRQGSRTYQCPKCVIVFSKHSN